VSQRTFITAAECVSFKFMESIFKNTSPNFQIMERLKLITHVLSITVNYLKTFNL